LIVLEINWNLELECLSIFYEQVKTFPFTIITTRTEKDSKLMLSTVWRFNKLFDSFLSLLS